MSIRKMKSFSFRYIDLFQMIEKKTLIDIYSINVI